MKVPRAPLPSSPAVTAAMRGNRSQDTRPELGVRRLLFQMGYRYRLHRRDVPGRPDVCFLSRRKVIFVHGCFWHQHASRDCPLKARPSSNVSYWAAKLDRNVERDINNKALLESRGWQALTVWECETTKPLPLERRLSRFLGPPKVTSCR